MQPAPTMSDTDIGEDLDIGRIERRPCGGGRWVSGSLNDHRFCALVFAEHAEHADYEIDTSRISKLWLKRIADGKVVYNWDRGLDIAAADDPAQAIVDFLCSGLAEYVFGE